MIYRDNWVIEVSFHANKRAKQRGISFDMVDSTLKKGRVRRFGRRKLAFVNEYKTGKVICIGEIKFDNFVRILTVERG